MFGPPGAGPCVDEFADFVTMNRMYRRRDFEFIGISADEPAKQAKALQFLKTQQASNTNYIFSEDNKYKLIEAIDPHWQGALPYTLLVEPGLGKIVYAKQGPGRSAGTQTRDREQPSESEDIIERTSSIRPIFSPGVDCPRTSISLYPPSLREHHCPYPFPP